MLTVDIVGCGEVAEQFHAPVLRHLRRQGLVRVGGCYDVHAPRARRLCRLLGGERWGTSVPDAPLPGVGAALVATPPAYHLQAALPYLSTGRHALIEKPFAATRADAERLVMVARASGARV
ncbi:MAG TPA: Gfo/Idh/MocA family oxidoreductase, partial [Gemmatimonadales bacterium]|nr:Gfo/Idh/MocA family oxidoreductase [Gemmatimonadales bacterium]